MLVVVGNLLLTLCSSSFDLVAMLFAPIELVSPLAGTTLILNIFVAPLVVNEKVYAIDVTAAAVMVPGLVVAVMFGPTGETPMTTALMEERMGLTPWVLFELAAATLIGAAAILVRVSSPSVARDDESRCSSSTILRRLRPFLYPTLVSWLPIVVCKRASHVCAATFLPAHPFFFRRLLSDLRLLLLVASSSLSRSWR